MSHPRLSQTEQPVYDEAERMLSEGTTTMDFSARFFGPEGHLAKLATTEAERASQVSSDLYTWLKEQLHTLRAKEADTFESEVQRASGRLTIAVARSLHAALKDEAVFEGVSLSELIRLKLAIPYKTAARLLVSDKKTTSGV